MARRRVELAVVWGAEFRRGAIVGFHQQASYHGECCRDTTLPLRIDPLRTPFGLE
jgi:hypothetical protein